MYSPAGLFWQNNLGFASVIPSEQTASSYIILNSGMHDAFQSHFPGYTWTSVSIIDLFPLFWGYPYLCCSLWKPSCFRESTHRHQQVCFGRTFRPLSGLPQRIWEAISGCQTRFYSTSFPLFCLSSAPQNIESLTNLSFSVLSHNSLWYPQPVPLSIPLRLQRFSAQ